MASPKRNKIDDSATDFNNPDKVDANASVRLKHPWVIEVIDGYLSGFCYDVRQAEKLKLCAGKRYFFVVLHFLGAYYALSLKSFPRTLKISPEKPRTQMKA